MPKQISKNSQQLISHTQTHNVNRENIRISKVQKQLTEKRLQTNRIERKYWFSVIQYLKQHALCKLSWNHAKPDKFFIYIANCFNGERDKTQIKSLDERLKKKYLGKFNLDIVDAIPVALSQQKLSEEQNQVYEKFIDNKVPIGTTFYKEIVTNIEQSIKEAEIIESLLKNINYDMRLGRGKDFNDRSRSIMYN